MARMQVSSSSTGPVNYTFESNPHAYEGQDSKYVSEFHCNDGHFLHIQNKVDDRIRKLIWEKYLLVSPFVATVANYFRSVEGSIRYFNFANIGDSTVEPRWGTSSDWKKARIIAVRAKYARAGKKGLNYEALEVELQPE